MKGLSNGTLKNFLFHLSFQLEMLIAKKASFLACVHSAVKHQTQPERETLIGLIMFVVIKHFNGTHRNVRLESQ